MIIENNKKLPHYQKTAPAGSRLTNSARVSLIEPALPQKELQHQIQILELGIVLNCLRKLVNLQQPGELIENDIHIDFRLDMDTLHDRNFRLVQDLFNANSMLLLLKNLDHLRHQRPHIFLLVVHDQINVTVRQVQSRGKRAEEVAVGFGLLFLRLEAEFLLL